MSRQAPPDCPSCSQIVKGRQAQVVAGGQPGGTSAPSAAEAASLPPVAPPPPLPLARPAPGADVAPPHPTANVTSTNIARVFARYTTPEGNHDGRHCARA